MVKIIFQTGIFLLVVALPLSTYAGAFYEGALLLGRGEFDEAIKKLESAIRESRNLSDARFLSEVCCSKESRNESGVLTLEKAKELGNDRIWLKHAERMLLGLYEKMEKSGEEKLRALKDKKTFFLSGLSSAGSRPEFGPAMPSPDENVPVLGPAMAVLIPEKNIQAENSEQHIEEKVIEEINPTSLEAKRVSVPAPFKETEKESTKERKEEGYLRVVELVRKVVASGQPASSIYTTPASTADKYLDLSLEKVNPDSMSSGGTQAPFTTDRAGSGNGAKSYSEKIGTAGKEESFKPVTRGTWTIKRQWTVEEFDRYAAFIERIYDRKRNGTTKQKVATLDRILSDPEMNLFLQPGYDPSANPDLSPADKALLKSMTHCGSFPKLLFVYYCYRRGLPCTISFVSGRGPDIRYSKGNHPVGYIDNFSYGYNIRKFFLAGFTNSRYSNFTTGNYRTAPDLEETDTVPMKIDRAFLKPGCIAYNEGGHALMVGKVTEDGEVFFLDAHPDMSITYCKDLSSITKVASIDRPERCYGGFRMMRLATLKRDSNGRVTGVRPMTNEEMKEFGYSLEQYEMQKAINEGRAVIGGKKITNYHGYIRASLASSNIKENPFVFIEKTAARLYEMFETRKRFVEAAWADVMANGPITLPDCSTTENIYQANGRWEIWSSPSSDVDRKCAVIYMGERLESMINSYISARDSIDLSGWEGQITNQYELASAILEKYRSEMSKYRIEYTTSKGQVKSLTLLEITNRLWDLSFDPNHAPEIRWGENPEKLGNFVRVSTPLNSGPVLSVEKSYRLEAGLRYYIERQDKPTRLGGAEAGNPEAPLEKLPEERLMQYILPLETAMK